MGGKNNAKFSPRVMFRNSMSTKERVNSIVLSDANCRSSFCNNYLMRSLDLACLNVSESDEYMSDDKCRSSFCKDYLMTSLDFACLDQSEVETNSGFFASPKQKNYHTYGANRRTCFLNAIAFPPINEDSMNLTKNNAKCPPRYMSSFCKDYLMTSLDFACLDISEISQRQLRASLFKQK